MTFLGELMVMEFQGHVTFKIIISGFLIGNIECIKFIGISTVAQTGTHSADKKNMSSCTLHVHVLF